MRVGWLLLLLAVGSTSAYNAVAAENPSPRLKAALRRPVALALVDRDRWLFAANRDTGSVSVIDTSVPRVTAEYPLNARLADLTAAAGGAFLLAVDERNHRLIARAAPWRIAGAGGRGAGRALSRQRSRAGGRPPLLRGFALVAAADRGRFEPGARR